MNYLVTCLLLLAATVLNCEAGCPVNGVWSEWTTGPCPTSCGSKTNVTRTRTCTIRCGDCACVGDSSDIGPCGIAVCTFPDPTCQALLKKCVNSDTKMFFCGTANVPAVVCP